MLLFAMRPGRSVSWWATWSAGFDRANRNAEFAVKGLDDAALRAMLSQALDVVNAAETLSVGRSELAGAAEKDVLVHRLCRAPSCPAHTGLHLTATVDAWC